jgi:hypothetical protein
MKTMKQILCVLLLASSPLHADKWVSLFDGKSIGDWTQKGGVAKYAVEDGIIVGTSVPKTPNSFLCTKKHYSDFILEYEFKCDNRLNSGVQIRSNAYDKDKTVKFAGGKSRKISAGRVHGYQVEIDANKPDRMWMTGIYDEGRRGWLYPGLAGGDAAKMTKVGQKAYKPDAWNKVRVECRGDHIQTWLNEVARADFKDSMTAMGFIGLQVHGVGKNPKLVGAQVRWRNLRIQEL